MDQYYTDEMKRCAEAIEADGLDATIEISATDLMILLSKAAMPRVPIVVESWVQPYTIITGSSIDMPPVGDSLNL